MKVKKATTTENGKLWLSNMTQPYRASILLLACLSVFATAFSVLFAYFVRFIINSASDKNTSVFWICAGVLLGFVLLKILLRTLENFFAEKIRAKMTAQLRVSIFHKILSSDYAKVQEYHSGELLNRLTMDIQDVVGYSVGLLPAIAGMMVQFVGSILGLFTIDKLFTVVYVVAGCLFAGITALFRKQVKKRHKEVLEADGKCRSYMQESVSSLMTVKAYGVEEKSKEKAQEYADTYYKKRMNRNVLRSLMSGMYSLLSNFGLILAVVWCSISLLNGNGMDYGSILSAILLLMQMQSPLSSISNIPPAYYARLACGERLAELEELPCEPIDYKQVNLKALYEEMQALTMDNLCFTYGRDKIFDDANAEIKKGEIVCLTGASGAGKSTIFKLLLNVFMPNEGSLSVIRKTGERQTLSAKERGLFAYVPQGNFLFSGTIRENLTFFAQDGASVREETLHSVLKTACAEFVFELPEELETVLTERGGGLSEGQLQRLAVARALLSNRPILLLDEATSALDADTEKALLENIKNLENKTCIIVTHRPAALEITDSILQIENGKISKIK